MVVFIILIILISILLILVVLIQNPKQGGLSPSLGGVSQAMGALRSVDWVEKATWTLTIALFVCCIAANVFLSQPSDNEGGFESPNIEKARQSSPATQTTPLANPSSSSSNELLPQETDSAQ